MDISLPLRALKRLTDDEKYTILENIISSASLAIASGVENVAIVQGFDLVTYMSTLVVSDVDVTVANLQRAQLELLKQITSTGFHDIIFNGSDSISCVLRNSLTNIPKNVVSLVESYVDVEVTLARFLIIQRHGKRGNIRTESGMLSTGDVDGATMTTKENVQDMGGDTTVSTSAGQSRYPSTGAREVLHLQDFFRRPIEIANFPITAGATVQTNYDVWSLWSLVPSVRAKLKNYAYFKGNLHLRIAVSGAPQHYGRLLFSYQPYAAVNSNLQKLLNATLTYGDMRPLLWNYLSQARGSITVDVKANDPVEMTCPFISSKPMFRLYNTSTSVISDVTNFTDFTNAGELHVVSLAPISSVSPTPSQVYVQIYAWMEDVELGCPTGTVLTITTESGEVDERDAGPIERFASGAAELSSALSVVPKIGPLAVASNIFFTGLASIASIFGWSRPVLTDDPVLVKNSPFQNGANTIGSETSLRITLDPKQELSIDPSIGGSNEDEMCITALSRVSTYLTTIAWQAGWTPMVPFWHCRVSPCLDTWTTNGTNSWYQPTGMSFASMPFKYWRGTIKYKFEIVTSAFHRGKIAVFYEPNVNHFTLVTGAVNTNKQFLCIVDIQETQTFEVCVAWANPREWGTIYPASAIRKVQYGSSIDVTLPHYTNGFISVMPFTALQSPDGSDTPINVFVSCDDLMVNFMQEDNVPQARKIRTESGVVSDNSVTCFELNKTMSEVKDICLHHFGERPASFRSLMKRYVTTAQVTKAAGGTASHIGMLTAYMNIFPLSNLPYGATSPTYNDLFTYLRYAYLGSRGSVRKRLRFSSGVTYTGTQQIVVTNQSADSGGSNTAAFTDGSFATYSLNGSVQFVPTSNGGVEFELPFYSTNLFQFSCDDNMGTGVFTDRAEYESYWLRHYGVVQETYGTYLAWTMQECSAIGEDFMFVRFLGAPYFTT